MREPNRRKAVHQKCVSRKMSSPRARPGLEQVQPFLGEATIEPVAVELGTGYADLFLKELDGPDADLFLKELGTNDADLFLKEVCTRDADLFLDLKELGTRDTDPDSSLDDDYGSILNRWLQDEAGSTSVFEVSSQKKLEEAANRNEQGDLPRDSASEFLMHLGMGSGDPPTQIGSFQSYKPYRLESLDGRTALYSAPCSAAKRLGKTDSSLCDGYTYLSESWLKLQPQGTSGTSMPSTATHTSLANTRFKVGLRLVLALSILIGGLAFF